MGTQTNAFRKIVRDHMGPRPVRVTPSTTLKDAVIAIGEERASAAIVVDENRLPLGILTERDVTRGIAFREPPDAPIGNYMTVPVVTVRENDLLYRAIAVMRRHGLRHVPVVEDSGRLRGMLSLHIALADLSGQTMRLIDDLTHEESVEGLRKVKQAQVEVAETLFADNVPVPEVQALLTDINRDIHSRVLRQALAAMQDEGLGDPPVDFALIIMGSGGRGENFLFPDQDNGFILDAYNDAEHDRIDGYFIALADRMTTALDEVGLPLCRGNIMATNPVWRKTRAQWREQITYWMRSRSNTTLRYCDIFFDFAHAYGRMDFATELRNFVATTLPRNPGFIKDMFAIEADHHVALGWFGRLISERDSRDRKGMINLKYRGTMPLVEGIRLLALAHGVPETATLARIDALAERDVLDSDTQDYLKGALALITGLLLRQQIADFRAGDEVTNFIPEANLSERERDYLVACFRAVEDLRGRLKSDFSGDLIV